MLKNKELKSDEENEVLKSILKQHKLEIGDYEGNWSESGICYYDQYLH